MKMKTWVLLSYLVVMLLPLVALYGLYLILNSFYERQNVSETITASKEMTAIEEKLENTRWYRVQPRSNYAPIESLTGPSVWIDLYRSDGFKLYSSTDKDVFGYMIKRDMESLYAGLYDRKETNRTFSIKKPVFADGQVIGFYEITLARKKWTEGVRNRTFIIGALLLLFLAALYVAIAFLLNRKLGRPLGLLIRRMQAFAKNEPLPEARYAAGGEIGEALQQFDRMRHQIEEARQEVERQQQANNFMVASLSHDLKTPLTSIRAYAEALAAPAKLEKQERAEYETVLLAKVGQMQQMIDDLAVYTSLRSSSLPAEPVVVESEEFFDMLLSGYEALTGENGLNLTTSVRLTGCCSVEPKQMTRLMDNLMSNAVKYACSGGVVWASAQDSDLDLPAWIFPEVKPGIKRPDEPEIWLLVQNEGPVPGPEQLRLLHEPFYQADTARTLKRDKTSSGLGLSIVDMIARRHGGSLELHADPDRGMLALCRLPKLTQNKREMK